MLLAMTKNLICNGGKLYSKLYSIQGSKQQLMSLTYFSLKSIGAHLASLVDYYKELIFTLAGEPEPPNRIKQAMNWAMLYFTFMLYFAWTGLHIMINVFNLTHEYFIFSVWLVWSCFYQVPIKKTIQYTLLHGLPFLLGLKTLALVDMLLFSKKFFMWAKFCYRVSEALCSPSFTDPHCLLFVCFCFLA